MDPSRRDIKRRHEDMAKGSRVNFNQVIIKVSGIEQLIMALLQRIETLEQERQRTSALEQTVVALLQHVDTLEQECQQLIAMVMSQQSNSGSNNQLATEPQLDNPEETQGDQEMVPVEIEENVPSQGELQETPDNESVV